MLSTHQLFVRSHVWPIEVGSRGRPDECRGFAPFPTSPALRARGGADRRASRAAENLLLWERQKSR